MSSKKAWRPDVKTSQAFYRGFNEKIFDNKLPKVRIVITNELDRCKGGAYGGVIDGPAFVNDDYTGITLLLNTYFPSFDIFVAVLGHEMVHVYQLITEGKMHHGNSFKKWSPKVRQFCNAPMY
jgi:hypothetical protein